MKKILLALFLLAGVAQADVKISQLPLGSAATTGAIDSVPYYSSSLSETLQLHLSDFVNLPSMQAEFSILIPPQFGNSGKVLGTNGTTTSWVTGGGGGGQITFNSISSGPYTQATLSAMSILEVDTTSGSVAVTLPDVIASAGWCIKIKDIGSNTLTINAAIGQFIDGAASDSIAVKYTAHNFCAGGGHWGLY